MTLQSQVVAAEGSLSEATFLAIRKIETIETSLENSTAKVRKVEKRNLHSEICIINAVYYILAKATLQARSRNASAGILNTFGQEFTEYKQKSEISVLNLENDLKELN